MPKPLFYIEIDNEWRSMRPETWRRYIRDTLDGLNPSLAHYGKPVVGKRPSRVKLQNLSQSRRFWSPENHIHIRSPRDWTRVDWEYEMEQVRKLCKDPTQEGHSIFTALLKRPGVSR